MIVAVGRWLVILLLLGDRQIIHCKKKKDQIQKSAVNLLEKASKGIDLISCKNSQPAAIAKLRLNDKEDKLYVCLLKYLNSNNEDGWAWSELGNFFAGKEDQTKASTCFKQANKLSGKISPFISTWHFIGPFVIGKTEVDGDPLESFGGITAASNQRYSKKATFYSELVPGGEVHWKTYHQTSAQEALQITPDINFNELVSGLGSLAITEWQGWLVGEFAVNAKDENVLIQCLGVHTVFVDGTFVAADVYQRDRYWFSVSLSPGIHTVYIRLRARQMQVIRCSFKSAGSKSFEVHMPTKLPDLVDGHIFSNTFALPITNLQSKKWLKTVRIRMVNQKKGVPMEVHQLKESGLQISVAPGQTMPVPVTFQFQTLQDTTASCTGETSLVLEVSSPGSGSQQVTVVLRCRKAAESFIYTFVDHDGSIQQAAAIQPLEDYPDRVCPILLTLHGTGVGPQNQADGYKRMEGGHWVFGLKSAWVLAPTRHGAHNWEGPGALTAMAALDNLQKLTQEASWIHNKADAHRVIFAGHSMGGHGAWHLATHYPDRALAVISLAGWIKKEEYGDSNLFFRHDLSTSYTDPSVKAIMEASIAENDADKHVSNLKGIPVLARIGANDRTVHPYFVRRMFRLLKESGVNITFAEVAGKEHWWWDTWKTNDGGAVNDPQLRNFTNEAAMRHTHMKHTITQSCDKTDSLCSPGNTGEPSGPSNQWYSGHGRATADMSGDEFTLGVVNPALGEGLLGVKVLRQRIPFRMSSIKMRFSAERAFLTTSNVEAFSISDVYRLTVPWSNREIKIDNQEPLHPDTWQQNQILLVCQHSKGLWAECSKEEVTESSTLRGPANLGPARRVAEGKFAIVTGTKNDSMSAKLLQMAVYVANLFYLTSDAVAMVTEDEWLSPQIARSRNLIVLGGPQENSLTQSLLDKIPLQMNKNGVTLGDCSFPAEKTGAFFLSPHQAGRLALVLAGNSLQGIEDAVRLASPTIPPMTRTPFSNLLPDFVLTGPDFRAQGHGGYLCLGFWGNRWDYRVELASCAC